MRDSLLAESPFAQVNLVDGEIEGSIEILDQELDKVRQRLETIDAQLSTVKGRKSKRDEIISRWG
jgi:hypothetical protein